MVIFHSYVKLPEGINHDWWFQMAGNGGLMVINRDIFLVI